MENVLNTGKTQLAHKPGEVLGLNYWTLHSPFSQKSILFLQKLFERNAEWKDKIKIIAVNIDEER